MWVAARSDRLRATFQSCTSCLDVTMKPFKNPVLTAGGSADDLEKGGGRPLLKEQREDKWTMSETRALLLFRGGRVPRTDRFWCIMQETRLPPDRNGRDLTRADTLNMPRLRMPPFLCNLDKERCSRSTPNSRQVPLKDTEDGFHTNPPKSKSGI